MYAASRGGHQRFGHLIDQAAGLPDIEHHFDVVARQFDVADQRFQRVIGGGEQLQLVALDAVDALAAVAQLEQRFGDLAVLGGEDAAALFQLFQPAGG